MGGARDALRGRERWTAEASYVRAQASSSVLDIAAQGALICPVGLPRTSSAPRLPVCLRYREDMATIGSMLAVLHAWVAVAGALTALVLGVVGVLDGAGLVRARWWLDRLAGILFVTMVAAVLLGPGIVAGVGMPSSPVHFLLAATAVLAVPALRFVAIRRRSTRSGWWLAAGAAVTLLALLGLWSTGS
jgi:hypothetical protein